MNFFAKTWYFARIPVLLLLVAAALWTRLDHRFDQKKMESTNFTIMLLDQADQPIIHTGMVWNCIQNGPDRLSSYIATIYIDDRFLMISSRQALRPGQLVDFYIEPSGVLHFLRVREQKKERPKPQQSPSPPVEVAGDFNLLR